MGVQEVRVVLGVKMFDMTESSSIPSMHGSLSAVSSTRNPQDRVARKMQYHSQPAIPGSLTVLRKPNLGVRHHPGGGEEIPEVTRQHGDDLSLFFVFLLLLLCFAFFNNALIGIYVWVQKWGRRAMEEWAFSG
jgi:hypothetical protein